MLTLELLNKNISEYREYVEAGKGAPKTLDFFLIFDMTSRMQHQKIGLLIMNSQTIFLIKMLIQY